MVVVGVVVFAGCGLVTGFSLTTCCFGLLTVFVVEDFVGVFTVFAVFFLSFSDFLSLSVLAFASVFDLSEFFVVFDVGEVFDLSVFVGVVFAVFGVGAFLVFDGVGVGFALAFFVCAFPVADAKLKPRKQKTTTKIETF